ncbi:MAG: 2-amino-4-hydroxy-6-hydroxymethyldihydropteridine diphosphokinase [Flavobacteriales bacterium]
MARHHVYLCIGGNLGDRAANLAETRMFLEFNVGDIEGESPIVESPAWQMEDSPPFLNQVIRIATDLEPQELMQEIAELEAFYGRRRVTGSYVDREMDVDVLSYDQQVSEEPAWYVPHPRLHLRRFVLVPLAALDPEWRHPALNRTAAELLEVCDDPSPVSIYASA